VRRERATRSLIRCGENEKDTSHGLAGLGETRPTQPSNTQTAATHYPVADQNHVQGEREKNGKIKIKFRGCPR